MPVPKDDLTVATTRCDVARVAVVSEAMHEADVTRHRLRRGLTTRHEDGTNANVVIRHTPQKLHCIIMSVLDPDMRMSNSQHKRKHKYRRLANLDRQTPLTSLTTDKSEAPLDTGSNLHQLLHNKFQRGWLPPTEVITDT